MLYDESVLKAVRKDFEARKLNQNSPAESVHSNDELIAQLKDDLQHEREQVANLTKLLDQSQKLQLNLQQQLKQVTQLKSGTYYRIKTGNHNSGQNAQQTPYLADVASVVKTQALNITSADADAQLWLVTHLVLTLGKRFSEYETMGEIFREKREQLLL